MKNHRTARLSFLSRAATLLVLAAVVFSSCSFFTTKDPFSSEYYTSNFISSLGFDKFVGASPTVPSTAVNAQWDFPYRYESGTGYGTEAGVTISWPTYSGYPHMDYMKLEAMSALNVNYSTPASSGFSSSVPSGLDGTSSVYRLEVVNLVDDCDFELNTGGTWTTLLALDTYTRENSSVVFGSHNMNLHAEQGGKITFTPTTTYRYPTTNTYNAFYRYTNNSNEVYSKIDDANTISLVDRTTSTQYAVTRFVGKGGTSSPVFSFAPILSDKSFADLRVDNFRIGKNGNMELRLLLRRTDTEPILESGVYSFSVWVHPDMTANTDNSSPYNLDAFVLTMRAAGTGSLSVASSKYAYAAGSGWKKLTATLDPGALQFDSSSESPVIELVIGCNDSRPGGVFLAQPELRFYPNGL